jgi:hypothetical protein
MKKKHSNFNLVFSIVLISISFFSCKNSKENDDDLKQCINQQIINNIENRSIYELNGNIVLIKNDFNIFDSLEKYENYLLKKKYLKGTKKKDYDDLIELVSKIENPEKILNQINKHNPFMKYILDVYGAQMLMNFHNCTRELFERNGYKFRTKNFMVISDLIIAEGYPKIFILKGFSKVINYNSNIQRLYLSYLILMNLDVRNDYLKMNIVE